MSNNFTMSQSIVQLMYTGVMYEHKVTDKRHVISKIKGGMDWRLSLSKFSAEKQTRRTKVEHRKICKMSPAILYIHVFYHFEIKISERFED